MKKYITIAAVIFLVAIVSIPVMSQCSVCTKTALQLGEKPARGLNQGILYLMGMPFAIVAFIGYRWWKGQKVN